MFIYPTKLNRRERKAQQLLAHYATCERLYSYLNTPTGSDRGALHADGKRISVALWKAEKLAGDLAVALCNKPMSETLVQSTRDDIRAMVHKALDKLPPGFFINSDPRDYALKIDNETPEGKAIIKAVKLHTDMGGFGILSPKIDGN